MAGNRRRPPLDPRPQGPPPPKSGRVGSSGYDPRGGRNPLALVTMGVALYLVVVWFGITVVGDSVLHSTLMGGLIVILAATGYFLNRRPVTPDK